MATMIVFATETSNYLYETVQKPTKANVGPVILFTVVTWAVKRGFDSDLAFEAFLDHLYLFPHISISLSNKAMMIHAYA